MNKYASGYTLLQALYAIGWIVIAASIFGGALVGLYALDGMRWLGLVLIVSGGFQGMVLLGVSAIGTAIIDGSLAQQSMLLKFEKFAASTQSSVTNEIENQMKKESTVSVTPVSISGRDGVTSYRGYGIVKTPFGYSIGGIDGNFRSVPEAERRIDRLLS